MTLHLTIEQIKAAARKAYDENRLTAQHGGPCVYDDGEGHCCAIGAAFPNKFIARLKKNHILGTTIYNLVGDDLVSVDKEYEAGEIQGAHDAWAEAVKDGTPQDANYAKRSFLRLIDHPEAA